MLLLQCSMEEEEQPQQDSSCPGESKNGGEAEGRPEKSETHKEEVAGGDGGTQLGVGEEGTQPEGGDGGTQPEGGEGGTQPGAGDGGTQSGGGDGGGKGKEKTGKAKRKEKRLRNEPQSVTGSCQSAQGWKLLYNTYYLNGERVVQEVIP